MLPHLPNNKKPRGDDHYRDNEVDNHFHLSEGDDDDDDDDQDDDDDDDDDDAG